MGVECRIKRLPNIGERGRMVVIQENLGKGKVMGENERRGNCEGYEGEEWE